MKQARYSESQIMMILKQAEAGVPVPELCREHGMSSASFYKWRSKYDGMDASMMVRMKELEAENRRLKRMYGNPQQNAYVERYNRTVRYDWLSQFIFKSIHQVQKHATRWLWTYNNERPNMAIGGITPAQKLALAA